MFWSRALIVVASAGMLCAGTLSEAVQSGDRDAVQDLLKKHADVNLPDADGTTPLQWAVYADDLRHRAIVAPRRREPKDRQPLRRDSALFGSHQ